jgi:hypothetical protein
MSSHVHSSLQRLAACLNGTTVAYAMGLVNAVLVAVTAFGVGLTVEQQAAIVTVANALLVLLVQVLGSLAAANEKEPTA